MSRTLIQIVPSLPPATSGVGDYGLALARVLRNEFGIETRFVLADEQWSGPEQVEGFPAHRLPTRSAEALVNALRSATVSSEPPRVLLEMSGYGYSRQGCPYWLLSGLRKWKQQADAELLTMFHELYASAPPWRKTFWFGPAQKWLVKEIARLSDIAVTSIQLYRERLQQLDPAKSGRVEVLAIPSNVGEPVDPPHLGARMKGMVVFGLPASRSRAYRTCMATLERACEQLGIVEVQDVGGSCGETPDSIGGIPVRKHGRMESAELSSLLSACIAGFANYLPESMAKSGVVAAYCAHRMVPVVPEHDSADVDGLCRGVNYYSVGDPRSPKARAEDLQAIADAAWHWYRGHSLHSHAGVFAGLPACAGACHE